MAWYQFAIRLIIALLLGALVGAERQWRPPTAGLCTNCLVALGSAMFVRMGGLIGGGGRGREKIVLVKSQA
jgi:putative Mg2+ transporter-C (MgtC) family protein